MVKSTMTETCSAVWRSRRNCSSDDGAERTDDGRAFHARAALTTCNVLVAVTYAVYMGDMCLVVDGQPCVVGADSDGYIPLRFSHGQAVEIVPSSVSSTDS